MEKRRDHRAAEPALTDAPLAPGSASPPQPTRQAGPAPQPAAAWIACKLAASPEAASADGLVYVASSERRADEIARALRQFAPAIEVLSLPPWDCLPYDRASPSREAMGRRMAVLARLREPFSSGRVLVVAAEALLQRVPPARVFGHAFLRLAPGERFDRARLDAFARATGYVFDERIDEPGEIAILGEVADVYPAAAEGPVRVRLDADGAILELRRYDPLSQRTEELLDHVLLGPASELIVDPDEAIERGPGIEHRAPQIYGRMDTVLSRLPNAAVALDPRVGARLPDLDAQILEAYEARRALGDDAEGLPRPEALYLTAATLEQELRRRPRLALPPADLEAVPRFTLERNPGRAFSDYVRERLAQGRRVALTGLAHELERLDRAVRRGLELAPQSAEDWSAVLGAPAGALLALEADLEAGFDDAGAGLSVIAAPDVLGDRLAAPGAAADASALLADPDLRVGDVVIHEDHGLGVLEALERVEVDGVQRDALRLAYHGGAHLLAPIEDVGRIWRYSAEAEAVSLDRLHTDAWIKRRAEISAEIDRAADHLVALAREKARTRGEVLEPPRSAYARFAARFPYPETPDQAAAIHAVLADMASGRVMSRLVCGDVGFGKTEVALRAAAAAALCGKQVAVVAPTTVLARQHYDTFRRRFAGTDVRVGRLSRLVATAEAREVKAGLADGSIGVVIGTHALAGKDVAFADLGLLIIDEEQRFGAKLKDQLRDLAPHAHLLVMTATPIPRTLQMAMVGVEDVSVIATPPARRRPIRTFLAPYDQASVRTALLRERRRGGQSFVVVPRIEEIEGMAGELRRLVPELTLGIAHGELPADEVDEVMVRFASGMGDVLLATNIIESGLDVPRANTMLVRRADLFGLAQLHQLRGRVGRGRVQGIAYLFTEPDQELPETTRARLSTLEAFDRLGSGLAISARDLELRGAGDLIGEEQVGHLKLIGTALYQRLLARAVRTAKGEISGPDWTPEINIGLTGVLSDAYVPDATIRINLYARLARIVEPEEVEAFAEELEDRFGPPPAQAQALIELARIRALARATGLAKVEAGPKAVALTPIAGPCARLLAASPDLQEKNGRLVWRNATQDASARAAEIRSLLEAAAAAED